MNIELWATIAAALGAGGGYGIPLGIKDLFCTEGVLTTAASHILDGFKPRYESTVTAKLKAAGSVIASGHRL